MINLLGRKLNEILELHLHSGLFYLSLVQHSVQVIISPRLLTMKWNILFNDAEVQHSQSCWWGFLKSLIWSRTLGYERYNTVMKCRLCPVNGEEIHYCTRIFRKDCWERRIDEKETQHNAVLILCDVSSSRRVQDFYYFIWQQ